MEMELEQVDLKLNLVEPIQGKDALMLFDVIIQMQMVQQCQILVMMTPVAVLLKSIWMIGFLIVPGGRHANFWKVIYKI